MANPCIFLASNCWLCMDVLKLVLREVVPYINIPLHKSFQKQLHGAFLLKSSSVMPCSLVDKDKWLEGTCCLHLQSMLWLEYLYCKNLWYIFLVAGLVKIFPTFIGCERSLSCSHEHSTGSYLEQDESSHPIKIILILSLHLCLGIPSGYFPYTVQNQEIH